jgi:hypothetical protein
VRCRAVIPNTKSQSRHQTETDKQEGGIDVQQTGLDLSSDFTDELCSHIFSLVLRMLYDVAKQTHSSHCEPRTPLHEGKVFDCCGTYK